MNASSSIEQNPDVLPAVERVCTEGVYVETRQALAAELTSRSERAPEVRAATDAFVAATYGIEGFSALKDAHFSLDGSPERPLAVLARQVGSINAEDVAHYLGSIELGLPPVLWSFAGDSYTGGNLYKKSLLKQSWIEGVDRNGEFINPKRNVAADPGAVESRALGDIICQDQQTLADLHRALRERVFGSTYREVAADEFLGRCLRETTNPPDFVFVKQEDGKYVREAFQPGLLSKAVRPPADWYYPLDMCCYLDGRVVLFETYDNPDNGVDDAKRNFLKAVSLVEQQTGQIPLVVEIPPLTDRELQYNPRLLDDPEALPAIAAALADLGPDTTSIKEMFERLNEATLFYGHEVPER